MPEILRTGRRRSLIAGLMALGLVASACGSSADETATAASSSSAPESDAESTSSTSEESDSPDETSDESADGDGSEEAADEGAEDTSDESASGENLFPDIELVNIVDGSNVNLFSELGGGDLPVLLWFWAPH